MRIALFIFFSFSSKISSLYTAIYWVDLIKSSSTVHVKKHHTRYIPISKQHIFSLQQLLKYQMLKVRNIPEETEACPRDLCFQPNNAKNMQEANLSSNCRRLFGCPQGNSLTKWEHTMTAKDYTVLPYLGCLSKDLRSNHPFLHQPIGTVLI